MSPLLFLAIAAGVGVLLAGVVVVTQLVRGGGSPIATATLEAPGPFVLELPAASGPIEIAIRFTVAFPYAKPPGLRVRQQFGLIVELEADAERLVFGKGGDQPAGARDFEGLTESMKVWAPGSEHAPSRYTATQVIHRRSAAPRTLRGSVQVAPGTTLERATILVH